MLSEETRGGRDHCALCNRYITILYSKNEVKYKGQKIKLNGLDIPLPCTPQHPPQEMSEFLLLVKCNLPKICPDS